MQGAQRDRLLLLLLLLQMDLHNRDAHSLQGREVLVVPGDVERSRAERDFSITIFITAGFCP